MKAKVVSSRLVTSRSLRARDYVLQPFEVIFSEEVMKRKIVYLAADDSSQARTLLDAMEDTELAAALHRSTKTGDVFVRIRNVRGQ